MPIRSNDAPEKRRSPSGPIAALVAILLLYVLSSGPAALLVNRAPRPLRIEQQTYMAMYYPLWHLPPGLGHAWWDYVKFCAGSVPVNGGW
jgi:hypothetical protein